MYNVTDPNEAIEFWHKEFLKIYDKHAPLYTKRIRHYNKPEWLDKELQEAIKTRDYLKKKGLEGDFRKQRNIVTGLKRKKMQQYFNKLIECSKNSKQIWNAINKLTNKHKLTQNTINISPQTLNLHFSTVADRVISSDKSRNNDLEKLREFCDQTSVYTPFKISHMHIPGVYKALNQLKQKQYQGIR